MIVTEQMKSDFRENGAIKLEGFLDAHQLETCRRAYEQSLANPSGAVLEVFEGTQDAHYNDFANAENMPAYERVFEQVPFAEILTELWDSEHIWFFGEEIFRKEGGEVGRSPWHQDTAYLSFIGEHMANFWISFDSLPQGNALEVIKGSHRGTQYDGAAYMDPSNPTRPVWGDSSFPRLPDIEAERAADPESWDVLSWALEPGDVLLLHSGTLHGGAPVDTNCPTRNTLVLRFFGDKVTYRPLPEHEPDYFLDVRWFDDKTLTPGEPFRPPYYTQLQ